MIERCEDEKIAFLPSSILNSKTPGREIGKILSNTPPWIHFANHVDLNLNWTNDGNWLWSIAYLLLLTMINVLHRVDQFFNNYPLELSKSLSDCNNTEMYSLKGKEIIVW